MYSCGRFKHTFSWHKQMSWILFWYIHIDNKLVVSYFQNKLLTDLHYCHPIRWIMLCLHILQFFFFFDICTDFHYSEFTWVCSSWCRNSPARQLFVQQHVYVNSNENSTLLALCEGNLPVTGNYAHNGQVMRKRLPWYHEITYHESILPQQCVDYCDIKIISRIVSTVCFSLLNSINMCAICNLALMGLHSFTKLSFGRSLF